MLSFFRRKHSAKNQPRRLVYMGARSGFDAAKLDRLTAGWSGITATQDSLIRDSLSRVRARARKLAANNDYAKKYMSMCGINIVGAQGIRMQARAIEREDRNGVVFDDNANRLIENAWKEWCKKGVCTADGQRSFIDVLNMVVKTPAQDGEIFVRKIRGRAAGNKFGFALQLFEADHVEESYNQNLPGGRKIRMGIEYNEWNRPLAYHVLTRHPGDNLYTLNDGGSQYERIEAGDIEHLYDPERVSQARGLPWLLSSMYRLNMLGGYEQAELVAARIAACKMGFYKTQDGASYDGDAKLDGQTITEAEPGIFEQLPEGTDFVSFDPQHPTQAFASFIKGCLRGVAAGLGVSYNSLANDLEGVNFSSLRQGALEDRDYWRTRQTWLIQHFCQPIFEDWLKMSLLTGAIPLPPAKFEKFNSVVWRPRGWGWVDPLKEVKSNIEAINAGLKSAQDVASESGDDIEEVYAQLAAEKKLREKHGITLGNPDMAGMQAVIDAEEKNEGAAK